MIGPASRAIDASSGLASRDFRVVRPRLRVAIEESSVAIRVIGLEAVQFRVAEDSLKEDRAASRRSPIAFAATAPAPYFLRLRSQFAIPTTPLVTRFVRLLTIGLALPLMGIGCSNPTEPRERLVAIDVGPTLVLCLVLSPGGGYGYGFGCMNVRELPDGDWVTRSQGIEGFEFKPGYRSRLLVYRPRQLPTDGSDRVYRLWKVVERVPVTSP